MILMIIFLLIGIFAGQFIPLKKWIKYCYHTYQAKKAKKIFVTQLEDMNKVVQKIRQAGPDAGLANKLRKNIEETLTDDDEVFTEKEQRKMLSRIEKREKGLPDYIRVVRSEKDILTPGMIFKR